MTSATARTGNQPTELADLLGAIFRYEPPREVERVWDGHKYVS